MVFIGRAESSANAPTCRRAGASRGFWRRFAAAEIFWGQQASHSSLKLARLSAIMFSTFSRRQRVPVTPNRRRMRRLHVPSMAPEPIGQPSARKHLSFNLMALLRPDGAASSCSRSRPSGRPARRDCGGSSSRRPGGPCGLGLRSLDCSAAARSSYCRKRRSSPPLMVDQDAVSWENEHSNSSKSQPREPRTAPTRRGLR